MNALRPYLKAVLPALLTVVAIIVQWAVTGTFDRPELATAVTGFASSLLTFMASNTTTVPPLDLEPPARLKVDRKEPVESSGRSR